MHYYALCNFKTAPHTKIFLKRRKVFFKHGKIIILDLKANESAIEHWKEKTPK